jgi:hypothetical protein
MNGSRQTCTPESGEVGWWTWRRFLFLLALALFAAFPKVTLGFTTFFYRDFGSLGYPGNIFLRESFLHGELPLWNPYSHCGLPGLAQMGAWYLPSWLCVLLPLPWAVNFFMLLHLFFGGAGMYWLARRWGAGGFAAAFAGFAYVFNGVTLSCFLWPNYIASLGWLPWVVGGVMVAWRNGGRWLVWAAVASAMQVLTATPELTLLTWFFLGWLWLVDNFSGEVKFSTALGRIVLVVVLAAGLTMVQMLPFFDLIAHSQRVVGNSEAAQWAMPGWGWANLLVPLFHCYRGPQGNWFQTGQEFLQSYYLGAGVLALGVTGAVAIRTRRIWIVVVGMILFCWVMALGEDGFFYERLRKIFPIVNVARFPVKFAILPGLLLPLLATAGIEKILTRENRLARRGFVIVAISFFLLLISLVWFLRLYPFPNDTWSGTAKSAVGCGIFLLALLAGLLVLNRTESKRARLGIQLCLIALLPLDAFLHSPRLVPTLPSGVLEPGMWEADGRAPVPLGQGRIMLSPLAESRMQRSDMGDFQGDFLGKRLAEWYNLNLLDMLPKVTGAFTLRPAAFDVIEQKLYYTEGSRYGSPLLDFLSVQWITSPANAVEWVARTNFLPVITAGQSPRFAGNAAIWSAIAANDFDPRAVVYLTEADRGRVTVSNQTKCVVSNARFSNNQIMADISAKAPSLVVLSQTDYHLWCATVDDEPTPILRANLAFQALQVPAGNHHLKLVYRDPNLRIGAIISVLSLAVCGGIWWRKRPV